MADNLKKDLERIVGADGVSTEERDKIAYSRDMWPRNLILLQCGIHRPYAADVIVWPSSAAQIASLVRYCTNAGVKIIPYGGGSGVCGGAIPKEGGIICDLKRLGAIRDIDTATQTVDVQAGTIGQVLENELNRQGYTAGHFPESIYCSTVGGWIAARGAGQMSSLYGKIDDMVSKIRLVTMDGEIIETGQFPWKPRGPSWVQMVIGSEGILGIVVDARLKVHPLPESRSLRSVRFPSLRSGLQCMREVMQMGIRPALLKLYDPMDTLLQRFSSAKQALLLPDFVGKAQETLKEMGMSELFRHPWLVNQLMKRFGKEISSGVQMIACFEGPGNIVESELHLFLSTARKFKGSDQGEKAGERWMQQRYTKAYKQSLVFSSRCFSDTIEVSAPWDAVTGIYDRVTGDLSKRVVTMTNFSHAGPHGCSIYFSFAGSAGSDEEMLEKYDTTWQTAIRAVVETGGTLTRHHGIGMLKSSALRDEMGNAFQVLESLKTTFDPDHLLNPGKLI